MVLLAVTCVPALAALPLVSVDFDVETIGGLAEVRVEQTFVNDGDAVIEAVYVFPLHEQAAVDGMRMIVGDRVVEGRILERGAAEAAYDEAVEGGYTAALTTQQRPNVFTQTVGNIAPGDEVRVELRLVQPVPRVDGAYELVLPLVTAPRFVADADWPAFEARLDASEPVWGPPVARGGTGVTAGIEVRVDAGLPLATFDCPSHRIEAGRFSADTARLVTARAPLDRDFVLRWTVAPEHDPAAALWADDEHLLLTFEPPEAPPRPRIVPRELIWVIDQSCSMEGEPIALVRDAMHAALGHVDARDSLRILRFSDRVWGRRRSVPATRPVLRHAHREIDALRSQGGTYLLDGVLEALHTRPDPQGRARTVVFLTDGLVGEDRQVLQAIADQVGDARLFAFGVGAAPNRWLLDEMARVGGGTTTWLRDGEPPERAVARFVDTLSAPVLTDITIDWGDWEVDEVWPRRLPALYAGQPLLVTGRVVRRGQGPVVLRGRLGDGTYTNSVLPIAVDDGRTLASTWARQKIANLERDLGWAASPEVTAEILATSLAYQVLSDQTAFVAIDRTRRLSPAPQERIEQPVDAPAGVRWAALPDGRVEEITVSAPLRAVDTTTTSVAHVRNEGHLQRIPAGRTYQAAVQADAGVLGAGAAPASGFGAANEATWQLDGVDITDPVSGTVSLVVGAEALEWAEILIGGPAVSVGPALGPVVALVPRAPTNRLELEAAASHLQRVGDGAPLTGEAAHAAVAGPLVRDHAWVAASARFDGTTLGPRRFDGVGGTLRLVASPNADHRLWASVYGDAATVGGPAPRSQAGGLGVARWEWFLSPDVRSEARVSAHHVALGDERRVRQQADLRLSALSLDDPLGGRHDLDLGLTAERVGWTVDPAWVRDWLGVDVAADGQASRTGGFVQDRIRPVHTLTIDVGARADHAVGRLHAAPRLVAAWDPLGDGRTKLAVGWTRRFGGLGLPTVAIAPERGLARLDEWIAVAEREVVRDVALAANGSLRIVTGLPTSGGIRVDQRTAGGELVLRKVHTRRWSAQVRGRAASLLMRTGPPASPDDGTLAGYDVSVDGWAFWDLPFDPSTPSIGLVGGWYAGPGQASPPGLPRSPRWTGGVSVRQAFDVRRGRLEAELTARYVSVLDRAADASDVLVWPIVPVALPELAGWSGPRLEAGLAYRF